MLRGNLGRCRHKNWRVFLVDPPECAHKKRCDCGTRVIPPKKGHTADKKERGGEDVKVCKSFFFFLSLLQSRGGRPQKGKEGGEGR